MHGLKMDAAWTLCAPLLYTVKQAFVSTAARSPSVAILLVQEHFFGTISQFGVATAHSNDASASG